MDKKKDQRVELCRIIACIMVIAIHINLSYIIDGKVIANRLLWSCLCADAVSVFWIISGFFIYKRFNYKHILKRTIISICIPLFLINLLYLFFYDGGGSAGIKEIIKNVLLLRNPISEMYHLWYMYLYIFIMIISPLIYRFILIMNNYKAIKKVFFVISLLLLIINDSIHNKLGFANSTLHGFIPAIFLNIYGYYLYGYLNKESKRKRIMPVILTILFMLVLFFRFLLLNKNLTLDIEDNSLLFWYSSFGLALPIILVSLIFEIGANINGKLKLFIIYIANTCFGIYIIHLPIINFIHKKYIYCWLENKIGFNVMTDVVYTTLTVSVVFSLSCILIIVYHALFRKIKCIVCKLMKI